jgi:cellulose biosynthesis protein BcsQ
MELLMDQVQTIEEQLEITIERLAIIPNVMTDSTFERTLIESVRASLPITLPFEIRKRVVVKEAYNAGRSIFTYEHKDKKEEIYETRNMYRLLAFDLRQRCNYV